MARSNSVFDYVWNDNGTLTVKVIGSQPVTFNPRKASAECIAEATRNGWKQRLADATAMARDPKTGASATPEERRAALVRLVDHYESGTAAWELKAVRGPVGPSLADIRLALARVGVKPERIASLSDDGLRDLARGQRVGEALLAIANERRGGDAATADASLDELLADDDEQPTE